MTMSRSVAGLFAGAGCDRRADASTFRSNLTAARSPISAMSTVAATTRGGAPAAVTSMLEVPAVTTIGSGSGGGGGGGPDRPTWPPPGMAIGGGAWVGAGVGIGVAGDDVGTGAGDGAELPGLLGTTVGAGVAVGAGVGAGV